MLLRLGQERILLPATQQGVSPGKCCRRVPSETWYLESSLSLESYNKLCLVLVEECGQFQGLSVDMEDLSSCR